MNQPDETILRRIKKCLALSESSNPHEAAAALRQAQKLMEIHGIDQAAIGVSEVTHALIKSAFSVSKVKPYELAVLNTVAKAFGCQLMWQEGRSWRNDCYGRYILIGLKQQVPLAEYTASVMVKKLAKARATYVASLPNYQSATLKSKLANGFCIGWAHEIGKTVHAFAVGKELDDSMEAYKQAQLNPVDEKAKTDNKEYHAAGLRAGVEAAAGESIYRPVNQREAQLAIG